MLKMQDRKDVGLSEARLPTAKWLPVSPERKRARALVLLFEKFVIEFL